MPPRDFVPSGMTNRTTVEKISISLPAELAAFLERYREEHDLRSRSEVVVRGLEKLRDEALADAYSRHAEEWRSDPDREFWDSAAVDDGLDSDESVW